MDESAIVGTELLPHLNTSYSEPTTSHNRLSTQKSVGSDATALLYRYGQEIGSTSLKSSFSAGSIGSGSLTMNPAHLPRMMTGPPSSGSVLFPPGSNPQSYEQFLQAQHMVQLAQLAQPFNATRGSFASSLGDYDEQSLMSHATAANQGVASRSNNKPLKVVSGSQFRLTTKGSGPCPNCDAMDKANKKNKELIRTLKLQIIRMEENFKDLKYMKANNTTQPDPGLKLSTDNNTLVVSEDKEWEARCQALEDELAKLKKVLAYERNINENMRTNLEEAKKLHTSEMKQMSDDCLLANNRCRNMEETITQLRNSKVAMQERDALKTLLSGKETENFQKQMTIEALQKTVQDLQQQLQDAAKKAAADSMMNKKALEKAIAGSVRLCVVAPTVNVHVNDTRHKFKSKISQSGLKSFLDAEVFEKYCFLYKQASDNAAPTGGNIEAWLQQMLAQMQLSIENHVNSAMDGSSL
eukprot:gene10055-7183_t